MLRNIKIKNNLIKLKQNSKGHLKSLELGQVVRPQ